MTPPRGALPALYANTFVMATGFYVLVPLLAVHLADGLGFGLALVGLLAGVRAGAQQGLQLPAGILADRWGVRRTIVAGVLVRAAGFGALALATTPVAVGSAGLAVGLGGALFHPASYAAYARLGGARPDVFARREALSNAGFVVGPLLGGLLVATGFDVVCWVAAGLFLAAAPLTWWGLGRAAEPDTAARGTEAPAPPRSGGMRREARRNLLALCVLNAAAWAIFTQLQLVVPLRLDAVLGSGIGVGAVYAAAAVLVLTTTVPVTRRLQARLRVRAVLALGVATMGAGIAVLGGGPGVASLLAGMVVFTLGQMVFQPAMSAVVAAGAPAASVATRFGVNGLALAVGGVVGSSVVGALLGGPLAQGGWAWAGFAVLGIVVAVGYARAGVG
ncbi:MFS transporter [Isoptericola sp. 4D.3]|uniref:MFS transporter n=1 Tax=Isoptericola peretonis TaxID=2918523 RepID=A0ABT0J335_9MICO|nr:MFS transporter [Isoptericola sp. 4D.3]